MPPLILNPLPLETGQLFQDTLIPAETVQAYLATEFRVLSSAPFTLRLKQASAELQALYHQSDVQCAAFLTAWNPYSETRSAADNEGAQRCLLNALDELKLRTIPGIGLDPSGEWESEPSCLVLCMSHAVARDIGNRFKQNAIVWAGTDAIPKLILLR